MRTRLHVVTLLILGGAHLAQAQDDRLQNRTPNTLMAGAEVRSPPASLKDMSWFVGRWTGTGLGGQCEEVWSEPASGAMMGMFRFLKEEKVVFYEFLTLVEHEGSLLLKLKHFNPDLTGWEEKADFISFRLLKLSPDVIHFSGITFKRVGPDRLDVFLAIRDRASGSVREEKFEMTKVR